MSKARGIKRVPVIVLVLMLWLAAAPISIGATAESGSPETTQFRVDPPSRVVCVVPSATEIILTLGAGDRLVGITHHSEHLPGGEDKTIVGGFRHPSLARIKALSPDLVIAAPIHDIVKAHCRQSSVRLMEFRSESIAEAVT